MPRPAKKPIVSEEIKTPLVTKDPDKVKNYLNRVYNWLKSKVSILIFGILVSIISIVITITVIRYNDASKISALKEEPKDTQVDSQRLDILEKEILRLSDTSKKLEITNEMLGTSVKQLEKRLQAHIDITKRMCEYIIVITVDKKIIPRQCLPDYNWKREEG
jgi:hypothetical protein